METSTEPQTEVCHHGHETHHHHHEQKITIFVNNKPVVEHHHEATGAQIKAAAIAQRVEIKPDFVLFEVKHGNELKQVGDEQMIHLHEHERFRACAPDDNS